MLRKLLVFSMLLITLAALSSCIIHDPGYYPSNRVYYSAPYYPYSYDYGPYLYAPFWFGGYYFYGDFDRGHHFYKHRGSDRHGGGGRRHR